MKKRAISIMIMTSIAFSLGGTSYLAMAKDLEVNTNKSVEMTMAAGVDDYSSVLTVGKTYTIKNNNSEKVVIKNDSSSYDGKTYDVVYYDNSGKLKSTGRNEVYSSIILEKGESATVTCSGVNDISYWVNVKYKEGLDIKEAAEGKKALSYIKMEPGKNYKIKNNNNEKIKISQH